MESSNLLSFREQAGIPSMDHANERFQKGICGFNPDGVCIAGGTKVSGSSGYRLSSLGYPPEQAAAEGNDCAGCHSFTLWYKNHSPYELMGWNLKTNRLPLVGKNHSSL